MFGINDCGLMLEPQMGLSPDVLLNTARQAEGLGFGYLFRSDHLLPTNDRRGVGSLECWTSLGAIAAITSRIRFGPLVSPVGFRNPALLARMACTVSSMSGGRLQLSLGAGWYEPEYAANGIPFPSLATRMTQLEEALGIILPLLRDGRVDFDGKHFSAHTDCLPRPPDRIHTIIGGRTRRALRLAAKYADEWNLLASSPDHLAKNRPLLERLSAGRKVIVSEMGPVMLGRTEAELEANLKAQIARMGTPVTPAELLQRIRSRGAFCGSPDDFLKAIRSRVDAGVERFYFQVLVPENTRMTELLAETLKKGF